MISFICFLTNAVASLLAVIKSMHMFQLNSYNTKTHLKWMRGNLSKFLTQFFSILLLFLFPFIKNATLGIILSLIFIVFCLFNKPIKNAKKPLVFTSRVKRMFVTFFIALIGTAVLSWYLPDSYRYVTFIILYVLTPILPLLVNLINTPIEASVRRYYINDAKKMLKSCPNLIVIGITGSYGKTSVKYYLTTLLKSKYNVLMTPESFNTPMGVVKTIREQLRSTHEVFICEMGARRKGEIKELCDIVFPVHGIITSIGEQHLETFKTVDTIIKTKFELADAVNGKGRIFLNGDNMYITENLPKQDYETYGCGISNNFFAYDINVTPNGTTFSANCNGEIIENLQTQLIGTHNVTNLMGAIALSLFLGVSHDGIRTQLRKIVSPPHRLQLTKSNGATIIDDAYNSNPNGCEAALNTLALFDGYKILITPGMVELGAKQEEYNFEFGVKSADVCDFVILVGEKQTKPIYDGLTSKNYNASQIFIANSFNEAIKEAYALETPMHKVILLENDLPDNY